MANPFVIQSPGYGGALGALGVGLGQLGQQYRQEDRRDEAIAQQQRADEMRAARLQQARDLFASGASPKEIAAFSIENPEIGKSLMAGMAFRDEASKQNLMDTYQSIVSGGDVEQALTSRAQYLQGQGIDNSDTLDEIEQYRANPESYIEQKKNQYALIDRDYAKTLVKPSVGVDPSAVKETEWFMKQPKEVQDKHLELKWKSNPTLAQKLEQKQAEADIDIEKEGKKTAAKGKAARLQGYIDSGIEAADSLGNVNRVLELLNSVETGGFDNAALRAKQMFGLESADEAELSAGLGKAILSQLKPIFGAAFTAAEGERLERIEASFGKSTAGNKRLVNEVKKITERAARRGLSAARQAGDEFTVQEIESLLKPKESLNTKQIDSTGAGRELSDEELLKKYGGKNG